MQTNHPEITGRYCQLCLESEEPEITPATHQITAIPDTKQSTLSAYVCCQHFMLLFGSGTTCDQSIPVCDYPETTSRVVAR